MEWGDYILAIVCTVGPGTDITVRMERLIAASDGALSYRKGLIQAYASTDSLCSWTSVHLCTSDYKFRTPHLKNPTYYLIFELIVRNYETNLLSYFWTDCKIPWTLATTAPPPNHNQLFKPKSRNNNPYPPLPTFLLGERSRGLASVLVDVGGGGSVVEDFLQLVSVQLQQEGQVHLAERGQLVGHHVT